MTLSYPYGAVLASNSLLRTHRASLRRCGLAPSPRGPLTHPTPLQPGGARGGGGVQPPSSDGTLQDVDAVEVLGRLAQALGHRLLAGAERHARVVVLLVRLGVRLGVADLGCRYGRNSASYERMPSQKAHCV